MHYLKLPGFTGIIHIVGFLFVFCFSFPIIFILIVIVCFSNIDMSQAEQVPEDIPAYLNDEPVGTGKLFLKFFLFTVLIFRPCCRFVLCKLGM